MSDFFDFLPKNATPRERSILCMYYFLEIKNPIELSKILNYKDPTTVWRVLKKYRGKVYFPFEGVILQLHGRRDYTKDID